MGKFKDIKGIIYPIVQEDYDLLKSRKNPIYVKFLSKNSTELKRNHTLIFYLSRKDKTLIGYSKIINVFFISPLEILEIYQNNIQMEKMKLLDYIHNRDYKNMLCLELDEIINFIFPVKAGYPITMMGKYIFKEEYDNIFDKN